MSPFFQSKKAAAILKHAVLNQYVDPFAMKTGSTSPGGRVAFIDGYAGEGRYADGGEGSPALLIRKAQNLVGKRQVECVFVEENDAAFKRLSTVVAAEGSGLVIETLHGDIEEHLDAALKKTEGIPLFVFLDPYGLMIPFDYVVRIFKRPAGLGAPATEVLINFSAIALRRIAGHLYSPQASEPTLQRMDDVCGGDWWRDEWLKAAPTKDADEKAKQVAEDAVVNGYAARLGKSAKAGWWTFDVRNRSDLRPAYHLVFLSRHLDGLALFGEALSLGLAKWRRAIFDAENAGTFFADEAVFKAAESTLSAEWVTHIAENLRVLLAKHGGFVIHTHYGEVFGDTVGRAREMHLRAAWRQIHEEGVTKTDSKGDLIRKRIEPA